MHDPIDDDRKSGAGCPIQGGEDPRNPYSLEVLDETEKRLGLTEHSCEQNDGPSSPLSKPDLTDRPTDDQQED